MRFRRAAAPGGRSPHVADGIESPHREQRGVPAGAGRIGSDLFLECLLCLSVASQTRQSVPAQELEVAWRLLPFLPEQIQRRIEKSQSLQRLVAPQANLREE